MAVVKFRCWKCHRKHQKSAEKIGQTFTCNCDYVLRVPKTDGGKCRVKTVTDHLVEAVVCGGGGALLGFCFAIFVLSRFRFFLRGESPLIGVLITTVACGLLGVLGGERAIDWIGDMIRDHEKDN